MEHSDEMHWNQMNCTLNNTLNISTSEFYISENPPPEIILPSNITCRMYHPVTLEGEICDIIDPDVQNKIMNFIKVHDRTDTGNTTELSEESFKRFLSMPCVIGILFDNNNIIGTMISVILRVRYNTIDLLTSYTTFLCIDMSHRNNGLAMILIRGIMKEGYDRYGINHGYYMTANSHHKINNEIKSWYRPINVNKAAKANFTINTFSQKGDRSNSTRRNLGYHIPKPNIIPIKVNLESYEKVIKILAKKSDNTLYLNPTFKEYKTMCKCFDIYMVGEDNLFMLFPMDTTISTSRKRVHNAQLALMIGDILPNVLWIAKQNNYDLLYGWCGSDITVERVEGVRGLITTFKTYLEFYYTQNTIENNNMMVPIF